MRGAQRGDTTDPANRITVPPQPPPNAGTPEDKHPKESKG